VNPFSTAIGNIGDTDGSGREISKSDVKIPYELHFTSPFKGHSYDEEDGLEWVKRLQEIGSANTHMLDVMAMDTPHADLEKIAEIWITTDLLTSHFGDERLHFQHVKTHQDRKYWPKETKKTVKNEEIDPMLKPRN